MHVEHYHWNHSTLVRTETSGCNPRRLTKNAKTTLLHVNDFSLCHGGHVHEPCLLRRCTYEMEHGRTKPSDVCDCWVLFRPRWSAQNGTMHGSMIQDSRQRQEILSYLTATVARTALPRRLVCPIGLLFRPKL